MDIGLLLVILGIFIAVLVNYLLGILLIFVGILLLVLPRLR